MAINIKEAEKSIQEQIIKDYLNGKSMRAMEREYNITRASIAKFLEDKKNKNYERKSLQIIQTSI